MSLLSQFEESIASLMPKHEADAYRNKLTAERLQKQRCEAQVREETAQAMEYAVSAIRRPACARQDIERAVLHLNRALSAAAVLDPEDI